MKCNVDLHHVDMDISSKVPITSHHQLFQLVKWFDAFSFRGYAKANNNNSNYNNDDNKSI